MRAKKEPPINYKKILAALLSGPFSSQEDLDAMGPILPSNANAFLKFALGQESLSDRDFTEEDKEMMKSLIERASEDGRNYVTYHDYPSGLDPSEIDKMSPEGRIMTALGRFSFEGDEESGYTVSDNYDFNRSDQSIDRNAKILGLDREEYIEKYKYNPVKLNFDLKRRGVPVDQSAYKMLRDAYAPIVNESRNPMPVKVNVK